MSKQFFVTNMSSSKQRIGDASIYSAHIQEAMRYDKLPSASYSLVMTILNAVVQGYTEEMWKEEQQHALKTLINQPTDPKTSHDDLANRYEQTISGLRDLSLWPW
jgi:DNA-binding MurR/RpiR family transcriptional regulator